ncbi:COA8 family protein CG14806, mitochondrial [Drosophila kikkawai]|uniref:COA8 family protein CG14806, mitochondrial n=1 Tax=Drosophila kikkawai TaxID=30033 RepID=A0A6P4J1G8_DROKI|nr:COA8 family protein CG14806, mitochondrial [Drosophila kikkawai]
MNKCLKCQPHHRLLLTQLTRCYAAAGPEKSAPISGNGGLANKPDPQDIKCDYIGPPDAQSNLRPYVRHYDDSETTLARNLRLKRNEVEAWNMDFWTRHNKRFYEEKDDFVRLHKESGTEEVSADQMSEFYKTFLDKNWRIHLMYNISWYLKNFDILTLAAGVQLQRLVARAKPRS